MIKAGLVGGVIGFIYVMSLTLLSPFCTLCFTPLLGIGVGYLANHFDKPLRAEGSLSRGSIAGIITGAAVVTGQIGATLVNGVLITNLENMPAILSEIGLPQILIADTDQYWRSTLTASSICSMLNLLLIVGLGAVGGAIWYQKQNQNAPTTLSF